MADSTETPGAGTYEFGPGSGRILVKTGREGLAARVGHDLTMEITQWSARVTLPASGGIAAATVTADLDLGSLTVREGTGGVKPLTDRDRRDIQASARKILGTAPQATFISSGVIPSSSGPSSGGTIDGTLTLHATSRAIRLQVTSPAPDQYQASIPIRQSEFGITPYSGFFGALKLRDEVTVEFEVTIEGIPTIA
jgi:polyisoprenoid-binding protein YceI